jgi:hypothetical protein
MNGLSENKQILRKIRTIGVIVTIFGLAIAVLPFASLAIYFLVVAGRFATASSASFLAKQFGILLISACILQTSLGITLALGGFRFRACSDVGRRIILALIRFLMIYCLAITFFMAIAFTSSGSAQLLRLPIMVAAFGNCIVWLIIMWVPMHYFSKKAKTDLRVAMEEQSRNN